MLKFLASTIGIIFLIGLLVVIGLLGNDPDLRLLDDVRGEKYQPALTAVFAPMRDIARFCQGATLLVFPHVSFLTQLGVSPFKNVTGCRAVTVTVYPEHAAWLDDDDARAQLIARHVGTEVHGAYDLGVHPLVLGGRILLADDRTDADAHTQRQ